MKIAVNLSELQWLTEEFLPYLKEWKGRVKKRKEFKRKRK